MEYALVGLGIAVILYPIGVGIYNIFDWIVEQVKYLIWKRKYRA